MPQLDSYFFFSEIILILFYFSIFYMVITYLIFPILIQNIYFRSLYWDKYQQTVAIPKPLNIIMPWVNTISKFNVQITNKLTCTFSYFLYLSRVFRNIRNYFFLGVRIFLLYFTLYSYQLLALLNLSKKENNY